MPLRKHDSNVVLEVIGAMCIVVGLFIAGSLYLIHQDLKNNALAQEKKITMEDLPVELSQAIGQRFSQGEQVLNSHELGLDNLTFFVDKIARKLYTEEEINAMIKEYNEKLKAQQEAAAKKNATPSEDGEKPSESPSR